MALKRQLDDHMQAEREAQARQALSIQVCRPWGEPGPFPPHVFLLSLIYSAPSASENNRPVHGKPGSAHGQKIAHSLPMDCECLIQASDLAQSWFYKDPAGAEHGAAHACAKTVAPLPKHACVWVGGAA
eukprot:SAG31_NODE_7745_length_1605_cov_1.529216_2_plen_129_part_00